MPRDDSTLSTLATAALALLAIPLLAHAKDKVGSDVAVAEAEIIVVTPGIARIPTGQRTASGAPINIATTQRLVISNDLDLRRDGDVDELRRRIRAAAADACGEIERSSDVALTSERDCIRASVRDAMAQAETLIYYKRG